MRSLSSMSRQHFLRTSTGADRCLTPSPSTPRRLRQILLMPGQQCASTFTLKTAACSFAFSAQGVGDHSRQWRFVVADDRFSAISQNDEYANRESLVLPGHAGRHVDHAPLGAERRMPPAAAERAGDWPLCSAEIFLNQHKRGIRRKQTVMNRSSMPPKSKIRKLDVSPDAEVPDVSVSGVSPVSAIIEVKNVSVRLQRSDWSPDQGSRRP